MIFVFVVFCWYIIKVYDFICMLLSVVLEDLFEVLYYVLLLVNVQLWYFLVVGSVEVCVCIVCVIQFNQLYNIVKIIDVLYVIVFVMCIVIDDVYLVQVIEQEVVDGCYLMLQVCEGQCGVLYYYVDLYCYMLGDVQYWMQKQIYLVVGMLLLVVGVYGIDVMLMEGFDVVVLDVEFGLVECGLISVVLVVLGYGSEVNFNVYLLKLWLFCDQMIIYL